MALDATQMNVACVATTEPGQTVLAQTSGYLPTNARVVQDPHELGAFYTANADFRAVLDRLPVITDWYAFPGGNSVRIFKMIIDEQRGVVTNQARPAEALARMVSRTRQILAGG
jgi:multiple sugar transport system substrate-binding protein